MKQKCDSSVPPEKAFSRRAALRRVVVTGLGLGGISALANEAGAQVNVSEPVFVPENDYPYFGYEPAE